MRVTKLNLYTFQKLILIYNMETYIRFTITALITAGISIYSYVKFAYEYTT